MIDLAKLIGQVQTEVGDMDGQRISRAEYIDLLNNVIIIILILTLN